MKIAVVFPGQGSQSIGMGLDLYNNFSIVKDVFKEVDEAVQFPLSDLFLHGEMDKLTQTQNAQPAIMAVSMAVWRVLCLSVPEFSARVSYVAGHSLGEYSALCAAESLTLTQTALLLRQRGQAMARCAAAVPGAMCAILGLDFATVQHIVKETGVVIANDNCPGQIVVSGTEVAIENAILSATQSGAKRAIKLPVSGAFHSPLMEKAKQEMLPVLSAVSFAHPTIALVENTLAVAVTDENRFSDLLAQQITGSVLWTDSVKFMIENGCDTFIECGPGRVLSGLIKKVSPDVRVFAVNDLASLQEIQKLLC